MIKTNMQQTSLDAYDGLKSSGKQCKQSEQIMAAVKPGYDYTLRELQRITGLEINAISGRVNTLKKDGLLEHAPFRKCSITNITVHPVRLPVKQLDLLEAA